jgi:hypothetical protein
MPDESQYLSGFLATCDRNWIRDGEVWEGGVVTCEYS